MLMALIKNLFFIFLQVMMNKPNTLTPTNNMSGPMYGTTFRYCNGISSENLLSSGAKFDIKMNLWQEEKGLIERIEFFFVFFPL